MGKHTAPIRDHLGQRSSSVPQPLAPRDVHPVILAANSREEAFPEVFADNPTSRQMFQIAPGALDQGCRVLCWGPCCLCLLVRRPQGALRVGTATVLHGRLPGCVGTGHREMCLEHNKAPHQLRCCLSRAGCTEGEGQWTEDNGFALVGQFSPSQLTCHFPLNTRGGGGPR